MFNPYTIKKVFTIHEAAAAICGIIRINKDDYQEITDFTTTKNTLRHAMETRELPYHFVPLFKDPPRTKIGEHVKKIPAGTDWNRSTIARADLLAWLESQPCPRPELLFPDSSQDEKPLHANERNTLLSIIRALAELSGIKSDGDAYRREAESLLASLSAKGIEAPCSEKTLAKHLSASFRER